MAVKNVYVYSDHTENMVHLNSTYPLFGKVQAIIASVPDLVAVSEQLGVSDIVIKGDHCSSLISRLDENLREKLLAFEPSPYASYGFTIYGTQYRLDLRNARHVEMCSMGVLLKKLLTEQERKGTVWFYNMTPVDGINQGMLSVIKRKKHGVSAANIFEGIKKMVKTYAAIPGEEIEERLQKLKALQFITEKNPEESITAWIPTAKTMMIDAILGR